MSNKVQKGKKQNKTISIQLDENIVADIKLTRYNLFGKINDFYALMNNKSSDMNLDFKLGCWVKDLKKSLNEFEFLISNKMKKEETKIDKLVGLHDKPVFQKYEPEPEPKKEMVNHPDHYNKIGIECIEVVRHFNFNRGNAIKYIWRAGEKDPKKEIEDLQKAIWYIEDEINFLKSR